MGKGGKGIILKPKAGDVLVWPNFDSEGKPCDDSLHRALSPNNASSRNVLTGDNNDVAKIAINLWFQGQVRKPPSVERIPTISSVISKGEKPFNHCIVHKKKERKFADL